MRNVAVLVSLLLLTVSVALAVGPTNITSVQAKNLIAKKAGTVLLDVRTPDEYRQARLKGSVLIPMGELTRRLGEIPRDRPVLVYCAVGSRSASVASFLASKGYREVYNMSDGIVGWYRNRLPIEMGR